ncbi:hypothetical protein MMC13_006884 [Lambiella insularis]|nr:hypothetical protein [Lambiella insularis]
MCLWIPYSEGCPESHEAGYLEECRLASVADEDLLKHFDLCETAEAEQAAEEARTASDDAHRALHGADRLEVPGYQLRTLQKKADAALLAYFEAQNALEAIPGSEGERLPGTT